MKPIKKILDTIREEMVLKLDFINYDFEIGWFWVIYSVISLYPTFREFVGVFIAFPVFLAVLVYIVTRIFHKK